MPNFNEEEVIDLTSYDYDPPCNTICDDVIDLANDSLDGGETNKYMANIKINTKRSKKQDGSNKPKEKSSWKLGLCSICWDKLGNSPMASTKCGHVYCLACLERSLKCDQRCPTCRRILKGASAYHSLYLELG